MLCMLIVYALHAVCRLCAVKELREIYIKKFMT